MNRKKKIVFQSDYCKAKTGFGRHAKEVLKALHATGKYEIIEVACGTPVEHPQFNGMPWKTYGVIPSDPMRRQEFERHGQGGRAMMNYGVAVIDEVVNKEKPDVFIGVNDIWGFDHHMRQPWFKKISTVIHTPIDSVPLLDTHKSACEVSDKVLVMAGFAKRELEKFGLKSDIVHNTLNENHFYPLKEEYRQKLRSAHGINPSDFIIGFLFRNQLRKSVPNLIAGFKHLISTNQDSYLLLHTEITEGSDGWDIPKLIRDAEIPNERVLVTHYCKECHAYEIRPFVGNEKPCKKCGAKNSVSSVPVSNLLSESDLNDIYNIMDVYCHPFTSGGQEMPIQEAKLAGLPTLCTNYSCGEDWSTIESGGFPLEWSPFYEVASNFMKASTNPLDICAKLDMVYKMSKETRNRLGLRGREYVISKCSPSVVAKQYEEIIDSFDFVDWSDELTVNVDFKPDYTLNDYDFVKSLFNKIAGKDSNETHGDFQQILVALKQGERREVIEKFFKDKTKELIKANRPKDAPVDLNDFIDRSNPNRIAVVMPESAGDVFMVTSLLPEMKKEYPEYDIYFVTKPQFFEILVGNPYIKNIIPYHQQFESELYMSGAGSHEGFFEICFLPFIETQRMLGYLRNGKDKIQFNLFNE